MRYALFCLAMALPSNCGPSTPDAPSPPLVEKISAEEILEEEPPLCRPADVPAGKLEIGDYAFDDPPAKISVVEEYGRPSLELELRGRSAVILSGVTADNIGKTLDFKLDGKVLMAPKIMEPITGGNVRISGNFTRAELEDIAIRLAPPCSE